MATYNYIKPHWRSGPHAVHDAPDRVLAVIEQTLSGSSSREPREPVRIDRCPEVGLTVAWISCSVSLYTEDEASSYRKARYVHAIAMDGADGAQLDRMLAQQLFEQAYGTSIITGVGSHQRILGQLTYPDDRGVAANFFADRSRLRSGGSSARAVGSESSPAPATSLSSLLTHQSPAPVLPSGDEDAAPVQDAEPDLEAAKERSTLLCSESPETAAALSNSGTQAASSSRATSRWILAAGLLALGVILGAAAGPLLSG
jgi:hypothetical protein